MRRIKVNFFSTVKGKFFIKDKKSIVKVLSSFVQKENIPLDTINIIYIGAKRMRNLNRIFRKKDKTTDCLSFLVDTTGEIYICKNLIEREENKEKSFILRVFHSFLHLSGYEHKNRKKQEKMKVKEAELMNMYLLCKRR